MHYRLFWNWPHWAYPLRNGISFFFWVEPELPSPIDGHVSITGCIAFFVRHGRDEASDSKDLLGLHVSICEDAFRRNKNRGITTNFPGQSWVFDSGPSCRVEMIYNPYLLTQMRDNSHLKSKWNRMGWTNPHKTSWEVLSVSLGIREPAELSRPGMFLWFTSELAWKFCSH